MGFLWSKASHPTINRHSAHQKPHRKFHQFPEISRSKMAGIFEMPYGYDYEFVEEVHDDHICVICQLPMKKPVQTKCGHRFCKACLDETLKRNPECPKDRQHLTAQDIFQDLATERKVRSFKIKCPQPGCYWQGELSNIEDHKNRCDSKIVPCIYQKLGCCIKVPVKDLNDHMESHLKQHLSIAIERTLTLESQSAIMTTKDETRYNYIWKIKDFSQQLEKAQKSHRFIRLYSEPFHTHKYGYKLNLKLYPNGDGDGKGTHVSLYLIVMRGEYDAILTWPFDWKVKFILMDQKPHPSKRTNIERSVDVDHYRFTECFQRPTTEENVGMGFHFVSHETLATENYMIDGALFLKMELEKPKTWVD